MAFLQKIIINVYNEVNSMHCTIKAVFDGSQNSIYDQVTFNSIGKHLQNNHGGKAVLYFLVSHKICFDFCEIIMLFGRLELNILQSTRGQKIYPSTFKHF